TSNISFFISKCEANSGKSGSTMTGREATVEIMALIEDHEQAEKFKRFRTNESTKFAYTFGIKVGNAWVPGKVVNLYIPTATISSFKLGDQDGLVSVEMTLKAFVDGGLGEVFLNLL
ncbi:unnamed protein product, partial [marine sediment metagenome]